MTDVDTLTAEQLASRPCRAPDYEAETRALGALSAAMATSARDLLQRLVETALELCGAQSAGISILDGGEPRAFHWHAVAGEFAPDPDRAVPWEQSACGAVLERDAPMLFAGP